MVYFPLNGEAEALFRFVQLCLCPDYVLVPESVRDAFVDALKEAYVPRFPPAFPSSPRFKQKHP
jgi:acyl-CoA reductase-like NAD-dependent aldehyde dehydrogenase